MKLSKLSLIIALTLSTSMLTACGGGSDSGAAPAPTPAPSPSPSPDIEFPVQSVAPATFVHPEQGSIFTSETGLSLYFFANDSQGQSNCLGGDDDPYDGGTNDESSCAGIWPPLLAGDSVQPTDDWQLVTRADGTMQWAFLGYPLYQYTDDSAQGDINGEGINGIWNLARPMPVKASDDQSRAVANGTIRSLSSSGGVVESQRLDKDGFSVYVFDGDPLDSTTCTSDACITNWPPIIADAQAKTTAELDVAEQENGFGHWLIRGKPLYLFAGDQNPGDTLGDGLNNVWHLAMTAPANMRRVEETDRLAATGRVMITDSSLTPVAADKDQFTLYSFDIDGVDTSNCTGTCLDNWPPLLANPDDEGTGQFSVFDRGDDLMQWAYMGKPLYFYAGDQNIGDNNGEAVNELWWQVRPAPVRVRQHPEPHPPGFVATTGVLPSQGLSAEQLNGLTLYYFLQDTQGSGESTCFAGCVNVWPPLYANEDDQAFGDFDIISRTEDDGSQTWQWTYKGWPMYFYIGDQEPGDVTGVYPDWVIAEL